VFKQQGRGEIYLNGVDVVGDDDERGLLALDEGGDVVDTVLDSQRLGALVRLVGLGL
jgi:hypothetical protein